MPPDFFDLYLKTGIFLELYVDNMAATVSCFPRVNAYSCTNHRMLS